MLSNSKTAEKSWIIDLDPCVGNCIVGALQAYDSGVLLLESDAEWYQSQVSQMPAHLWNALEPKYIDAAVSSLIFDI